MNSEVKNEGLEVVASIICWNCEARVSLDERSEADGQCRHCTAELELDDYLAEALAGYAVRDARIAELERWITEDAGPHALKKWPTDTSTAYENDRVQDYRTGWVECLNRLNAADQEGDV